MTNDTQAIIDTANESEAERQAREENYLRENGWTKCNQIYQQWTKQLDANRSIVVSRSLAISIQGDLNRQGSRKFHFEADAE